MPTLFGISFSSPNQLQSIRVGVSVRGSLQRPVVALISEPPLSQDDILSYLLFGKPRSQLNEADALSALGSLASQLNLQGSSMGNPSNNGGGLFSLFTTGLSSVSQGLGFNLPLTKYFSVQTEANFDETGVDVMYNRETD